MKKLIILLLTSIVIFANDVDTQRFKPAFGLNGMLNTETNEMMKKYDFSAFIYFHYDKAPFVLHQGKRSLINGNMIDESKTEIVDNVIYSDLMFTFALFDFMELGINLPLSIFSTGTDPDTGKDINKFNLGDLRTGIRLRFLNKKMFDMGLAVNIYIPTGGKFNTSDGFRFQAMLMNDLKINKYRLGFNIGYTFKSSDYKLGSVEVSDEIFYSIGNKYKVTKDMDLLLELFGAFQVSRPFKKKEETPLELLASVNYWIGKIKISPALALGLSPGVGTPIFRAIVGVGYVPRNEINENDYDKDGILNEKDKCPRNPEDKDGFEDEDGCPELDNDKDNILDKDDKCPNDAEDKDNFEDEDGCPELDNDKDKILDKDDKCPNDAEDFDNFEDEDGCPDLDNDKDKILDKDDKCPNKPENYNGFEDEDGCPDVRRVLDNFDYKKAKISKKVYFKTDSHEILPKSYRLLNIVAKKINETPEIKKVRIEGHTDDVAVDEYNQSLSERRANSVREYLINKAKVSSDKLISKGFGEKDPIIKVDDLLKKLGDENISKEDKDKYNKELSKARSNNRRVEFKIIEIENKKSE